MAAIGSCAIGSGTPSRPLRPAIRIAPRGVRATASSGGHWDARAVALSSPSALIEQARPELHHHRGATGAICNSTDTSRSCCIARTPPSQPPYVTKAIGLRFHSR